MSQFKVITTNTNNVWDSKKRYKVNSVVSHNDILYQNITGKNSSPDTLVDWIVSKAVSFLCIPLSGTTAGNPVTGDVEFSGCKLILSTISGDVQFLDAQLGNIIIHSDAYGVNITASSGLDVQNGITSRKLIIIADEDFSSRGIVGNNDYSGNITDLDYTQKIYVDGLRGKHISKTTTEINAIVTPQAGETYFNTTLLTLCFWDGSAWKRVSNSAM